MKKIFLILIVSLLFIVTGCNSNKTDEEQTGCFNKSEFGNNKYTVSIDSINCGHPSSDNLFSISTKAVSKQYKGKKYNIYYHINFVEIYDYKAKNDYSNIDSYKEITINNKKFKYIINENNINLIYEPSGMDCYLLISVSTTIFNEKGDMADNELKISIDDLNNEQIKGTINFELNRK